MHLIKTTPFATTIKHGKKNLHQLAKVIQPWIYSKKKLARAAANSAMMEFHELPPWNRLTFPEAESDDNRESWYKGDEKKFMSRGSLPSYIDIDDDQESLYEGDERFFDIEGSDDDDDDDDDDFYDNISWYKGDDKEDMPPLKIRLDFDKVYQEVLREHEADRKRLDAEADRLFEILYG